MGNMPLCYLQFKVKEKDFGIPSPSIVILCGVSIPSWPAAYRTYVMIIMGHRAVIVIDGVMNRNIIRMIHHFNGWFDSGGSNTNRNKGLQ